jgi:chemotaxis signal transduction protein
VNAAAREVATTQRVLFALAAGRHASPFAPPAVLGALDLEGHILPVFDLRERFRSFTECRLPTAGGVES